MDAGHIDVVITADPRPFSTSVLDLQDRLIIKCAPGEEARIRGYARLWARHLTTAAEVFTATAAGRRRLDPRRLTDRWHARACLATSADLSPLTGTEGIA